MTEMHKSPWGIDYLYYIFLIPEIKAIHVNRYIRGKYTDILTDITRTVMFFQILLWYSVMKSDGNSFNKTCMVQDSILEQINEKQICSEFYSENFSVL